jgi:hypothetical protein
MLVEAERDGNTNIIPGADEATIRRLIPGTGFNPHVQVNLSYPVKVDPVALGGKGPGGQYAQKQSRNQFSLHFDLLVILCIIVYQNSMIEELLYRPGEKAEKRFPQSSSLFFLLGAIPK